MAFTLLTATLLWLLMAALLLLNMILFPTLSILFTKPEITSYLAFRDTLK